MYERFRKLDREKTGVISREEMMMVPELAMNPLADRIVDTVLLEAGETAVNFKRFLTVIGCFHHNSPDALKYLFKLFDCDGDGVVSRADLRVITRMMVGGSPDSAAGKKQKVTVSEEQLESMVEATAAALGAPGDSDTVDEKAFAAYARSSGLVSLMHVDVSEDED
jgi:Ca2+-binding EF-hand superfamily protein